MSDDEYDHFPDDFADIGGIDWDRVLPSQPPRSTHAQVEHDPAEDGYSDGYFNDDEPLDTNFLAEVDALERAATSTAHVADTSSRIMDSAIGRSLIEPFGTSSSVPQFSHLANRIQESPNGTLFTPNSGNLEISRSSSKKDHRAVQGRKRQRSGSSSPIAQAKKGKTTAAVQGHETLALLCKLEDECQCPLCFDTYVSSHVANPCGHSFCGPCGWNWIVTSKKKTCPLCRTTLSRSTKMIPNVALDSLIEEYIQTLGCAGIEEWRTDGKAYIEWAARKQTWKSEVSQRERSKGPSRKKRQSRPNVITVEDDEDEDPTYHDEFDFDEW